MTNSEARKRAQAAASQVQGAAEVGADVEELRDFILAHDDGPVDYFQGARLAEAVIAAGWVPAERVAEARAEGWDEGFEASFEWVANNPGPSGIPHDPPRNPHDGDDS